MVLIESVCYQRWDGNTQDIAYIMKRSLKATEIEFCEFLVKWNDEIESWKGIKSLRWYEKSCGNYDASKLFGLRNSTQIKSRIYVCTLHNILFFSNTLPQTFTYISFKQTIFNIRAYTLWFIKSYHVRPSMASFTYIKNAAIGMF